jgi:hypothetical protein
MATNQTYPLPTFDASKDDGSSAVKAVVVAGIVKRAWPCRARSNSTALLAGRLPARRASRLAPTVALRAE